MTRESSSLGLEAKSDIVIKGSRMHQHVHGVSTASGSLWQFFLCLFDTDFMKRGDCVAWRSEILWLHIVSDAMITLAYYSIPVALLVFVRRRKDLAFNWMFLMFAGFIVACGTTHALDIIAFWYPMYRLDGVVKAGTGVISIATAVALWPLIPRALRLPSPEQLRAKNHELHLHTAALTEVQEELRRSHAELEQRVADRTAELTRVNEELRAQITARANAEAESRLNQTRLHLAFKGAPIIAWTQDLDLRITWIHNGRMGIQPSDVIGRRDEDICDAESAARLTTIKRHVIETGQSFCGRVEFTMSGSTRVLDVLIEANRSQDGAITGLTGIGFDITEQSQTELQLAFQKYALDQHAIVAITDNKGVITYVNDKFCAISGYSREELMGQDHRIVNSGFHPKSFFKEMFTTISKGGVWRAEIRNRAKDGRVYWVDTTIVPMLDFFQRVTNYVAIRSDITSRKSAEESQRYLIAELDHRVKNNLAVVLSIAQETMRHSGTKEEFGAAFVGRIRALARTHAALAADKWEGTGLQQILRITLEPHLGEGSTKISIKGDDLTLSHRAASVLSMTFNELATNAMKYGALGAGEGRVCIEWHLSRASDQSEQLVVSWVESGGPPVVPPTRKGLGTRFIADGVSYELGGTVSLEYPPAGVRCIITLPTAMALADYAPRTEYKFGRTT